MSHLPWNAYSRKNVGYLWAIQHGARTVYETDDDNELLAARIAMYDEKQTVLVNDPALVFADGTAPSLKANASGAGVPHVINPYTHFGQV